MRLSTTIALAAVLLPLPAAAQQAFVPFTVDAAKFQQIDEAMASASMPRQAHTAWFNLWQGLERQAQADAAKKAAEAPPAKEGQ